MDQENKKMGPDTKRCLVDLINEIRVKTEVSLFPHTCSIDPAHTAQQGIEAQPPVLGDRTTRCLVDAINDMRNETNSHQRPHSKTKHFKKRKN